MKPPSLDLMGGAGISLCLVLWRGTCPGWLSPLNGDSGCTQILTRHCGALSQTVSQLASSRTTPTSKSPQLRPSGLTKHLRTGLRRIPHHILTTQMEPWDFIKSCNTHFCVIKISQARSALGCISEFSPMKRFSQFNWPKVAFMAWHILFSQNP
jgi:hypothetical protein